MAAMGALTSGLQQLQLKTCQLFGTSDLHHIDNILPKKRASLKPLVIEAKANAKTESAKTRNIRLRKKVCFCLWNYKICVLGKICSAH
ncbi:unnamed protein product [Coffea canephora]|uniref:Uncharacterized protein n=1 Tax=Coffea canephora TaxID=49390 RepID=A0A068V7Q8_COFCA|nr:unnamed protein product [Coffea canephora]